MAPSPVLFAQASDVLGQLARGGTGALIVALCVAVWWLSRRNDRLHTENTDLHKAQVELLKEQAKREVAIRGEMLAVVDRYNDTVAQLNDARLGELRRIEGALRGVETDAEDAPAPSPPRPRRKSGNAS